MGHNVVNGSKSQNGYKDIYGRELKEPIATVHMGLIYINPEGPDGNLDMLTSARNIRTTIGRIAIDDEETVVVVVVVVIITSVKPEGLEDHVGAILVYSTLLITNHP